MLRQATCHECGSPLELSDPQEGQEIECSSCGLKLRIVIVTPRAIRFETVQEEI